MPNLCGTFGTESVAFPCQICVRPQTSKRHFNHGWKQIRIAANFTNGREFKLLACVCTYLLPGFVPFKCRLNQLRIETRIGLAKPFHGLRQIEESPRCRLFKQSNRSDHGKSAMNRRAAPGSVIYQDGGGFDLLREANGFRLTGIHAEREV